MDRVYIHTHTYIYIYEGKQGDLRGGAGDKIYEGQTCIFKGQARVSSLLLSKCKGLPSDYTFLYICYASVCATQPRRGK